MNHTAIDHAFVSPGQVPPQPAVLQSNLRAITQRSVNNYPYIDVSIVFRNPERFGLILHARLGRNGSPADNELAPAIPDIRIL